MVVCPSWSIVCFMDNHQILHFLSWRKLRHEQSFVSPINVPDCIIQLLDWSPSTTISRLFHRRSSEILLFIWTYINFDQLIFSSEFLHDRVLQLIFWIYIQQDHLFVWSITKSYLIVPQVSRLNIRHDQTFLHC